MIKQIIKYMLLTSGKFSVNSLLMCFTLVFFLTANYISATVIGSDTNVARQARAFFRRATSSSNKMKGFSIFKNGFVLENTDTSADFDAFFPVSGDIVLNGGTLNLLGDIEFKNPFRIGVGTIIGNEFALEFPRSISYLDFPSQYYVKLIVNLVDQATTGNDVYSIDWSYDDAYLAVGLQGSGGNNELKIFSFDGTTLTEIASEDFGANNLNTVRWSPSTDYIITGAASGGAELKSWLFTRGVNTLQEIGSVNFGIVKAVVWSPNNSYVAVGGQNTNTVSVYPIAAGLFGSVSTGTLGETVTVRNNALHWNGAGDHLAVGLQQSVQAELKMFSWNGSALSAAGETELGVHCEGVAWRPSSSLIAVGLGSGSERLRIYSYDAATDTLTELQSARTNATQTIYGVAWDADGRYLAVAKGYAAQGYELELYYFDDTDNTLHLVSGYSPDSTSRAVAWAHSGDYVANGDDAGECYTFNFEGQPFRFRDLKIYFSSEVRAHAAIHFQGDCVLNGGGNILQLSPTSSLVVEPGATLKLEDITIKGVGADNIYCMDSSSVLSMRDVHWMQDSDMTFTTGSMLFNSSVTMAGEATLSYQSLQTSTVVTKSELTLDPLFTFAYAPLGGADSTLLAFEDGSSKLVLNGATITTNGAGLHLKKGKLLIERDSFLFADSANGITLGNSSTSQDFACDILSGSILYLMSGALNYKNVQASSWNMVSERSWLKMMNNTRLRLYESIDLGLGALWIEGDAILSRLPGKELTGIMVPKGRLLKAYMGGS